MAIRPGIYVALAVIFGGASRPAGAQIPPNLPSPNPLPRQRQSIQYPGSTQPGPAPATAAIRRLPAPTSAPPSALPDGTAWQPETLDQAWATALAVDRHLEAKRVGVWAAEEGVRVAEAQRWPRVDVEGSYDVRSDEPAFRFHFEGIPLPSDVFPYAQDEYAAFRAKVDVPLYTSGRIRHGIDAAGAELTSAQLEAASSTADLKMQVAGEYVAVLRAQRDVEVTQSSVRSLDAHARDVELLFTHDQVPKNDLLAAQVALSNARQREIQASNRLDAARAAYNRRLGRTLTAAVRILELPVESVGEDIQALTARAARKRPEISRLAARIRALRHQADSLSARSRPQFQLRGEYVFEENRFRTPEGIVGVGVGASWNVFDAGRSRHEAAVLLRRAESLLCAQADLESTIALDVRRAWLDVQETRRRLEVTPEACQQAEENLRVARKRYALGRGTHTEVLDAEALWIEAQRNHAHATYDAVLAVLRLRHATGDLAP